MDEIINSLLVLQRLSVVFICAIDSRNAALSANCVLEWINKQSINFRKEPYAIEAIQILARISDFKEYPLFFSLFLSFLTLRMKISSTFTLPDLPPPELTIETAELNLLSDPHGTFPRFHPPKDSETRLRAVSDQLQPSALLSRQLALSNLFSLRFDRFARWSELVIHLYSLISFVFFCFCIELSVFTLFVAPNPRFCSSIRRRRSSFSRRNSPSDWTKPTFLGFSGFSSFHDSLFAGSDGRSVCEHRTAGNRLVGTETLGFGELFPVLFLLFPFPRFSLSILVLLRYYQDQNQPLRAGSLARQLYEHNRGSFNLAFISTNKRVSPVIFTEWC